MSKTIVIIGGGLSGLSLLHFLRKKYANRSDVRILLLEKNNDAGGNIRTILQDHFLFECGPNGFLANQAVMLELIQELGLSDHLIQAESSAKRRYVLVNNELHAFPMSPLSLFSFKPMTFLQKLRIFLEPFVARGNDPLESLDHFIARRFGNACAKYFADPFVSGVYAGRSDYLSVQSAFPLLYQHEQKFGSVIKGFMQSRHKGSLKGGLKSFSLGMGQLVQSLSQHAGESVHCGEPVKEIIAASPYYLVVTDKDKYAADELFIASPAYAAGDLVEPLDGDLANALRSIEYAPVSVVGMAFQKAAFERKPDGFGYLIPSSENTVILGVLFESNIFKQRCQDDALMLRVMIGGVRNPQCASWSQEQLIKIAFEELSNRFGVKNEPIKTFVVSYTKAIPQYENQDVILKKRINARLFKLPKLFLRSNYMDGVSMNDCVKNGQELAQRSNL